MVLFTLMRKPFLQGVKKRTVLSAHKEPILPVMLLEFTSIPIASPMSLGLAPGFLSWDVCVIIHDKVTHVNGLLYCDCIPCLPGTVSCDSGVL